MQQPEGTQQARPKTAVITGASSGIGRATALAFARKGYTVVLVARREHALQDLAAECRQYGVQTLVQPLDVTDENALKGAAQKAADAFGGIDVWVNDAGVALFGRFEEVPTEVYRRVIETNFFGYVNGARAVIPYFRRQGQGVLINVSSIAGVVGQPFTSAYSASTAAVNGFSESLREELRDEPDIRVCVVLAPSVDTPLFQHAANYSGRSVKPVPPVYPAERAAALITALAERPQDEVAVGSAGKAMAVLHNLMPAFAERLMSSAVKKEHFQDKPSAMSEGNLFKPMQQWTGTSGEWTNASGGMPAAKRIAAGVLGLGLGAIAFAYARGMFGLRRKRLLLSGRLGLR